MEYGIWTLIPVLFVIAFALKTKRTLEPLIFGSLRCWENPMEHWDLQGRLESSAGGQGPP